MVTLPASFPHIKVCDGGSSLTKVVDFTKVSFSRGPQRVRKPSTQLAVARNPNSGSDTVELEPASDGSPLLGMNCCDIIC
jgi:(E)-4-hydroxy-3-methylbut-2-enyl-diphosphate synthase